mmetsp:Transcript_37292/g.90534  ORF Transcript_37292/g.90534 Transcript_37292/m.90534 type:complete len:81 (+) Transcript_37292:22-264(+)
MLLLCICVVISIDTITRRSVSCIVSPRSLIRRGPRIVLGITITRTLLTGLGKATENNSFLLGATGKMQHDTEEMAWDFGV